MVAGRLNLVIEQGATFSYPLTVSDSGVTRNLTGYTARMMVREDVDATSPLLTLTTENGRIIIAPDQVGDKGEMSLLITAADTAALTFDSGVYDLELVNGSVVERLLEGKVKLKKEVTR
jgi:hypothetical protein